MAARSNHVNLVDMIIKADRFYQWEKVQPLLISPALGVHGTSTNLGDPISKWVVISALGTIKIMRTWIGKHPATPR